MAAHANLRDAHPAGGAAPLVEVRDLVKHFPIRKGVLARTRGHVRAVDGVSLDVRRAETVALVGESGCGKSTTARLLLRLLDPTAGSVRFAGRDVLRLNRDELRRFRRRAQIVFQDPFGSLNPRMSVGAMLREVLGFHRLATGSLATRRIDELLEAVGLHADDARKYPHEFSGGQRQRIGIARALAVEPEFIVADEPVSALDVSVQAQVLNLLADLQERFQLTYLFITHDLSVVRHVADRVAVMYLGRVVELNESDALFRDPLHPYTQALLSAVPVVESDRRRGRIVLSGELGSPADPPPGCPFHPRCPHPAKDESCRTLIPRLELTASEGQAACLKIGGTTRPRPGSLDTL
jgi:oligopeptide/dipeptide ABC transporter ATP-binding protein